MASFNPPGPLTRFGIFVLAGGVALVLAFWGVLRYLSDVRKPAPRHDATHHVSPAAGAAANPAGGGPGTAESDQAAAMARLNATVAQALAVLRDPTISNKKAALDALKDALRSADPKVAVAVIRQFLDSKQDAPTGLKFTIGDNHELDEAPTMRTFMMDQLGDISLGAGLGDAAEVARATLESKDSPDEWALAMRNLALADPDGSRSLLAAKARELITYPPWQQTTSGGYLEAFDVAAYAGDPNVIADLAPLMGSTGTLQRASRIALQRLSALAPEQVADYLNAHPTAMSDYPLLRADYMGSMDLSSPTQLAQAETYLARTDITDAEKSKFIGRLGLPVGFVSNTLVTPEDITTVPVLEQRVLANQTARTWLASGKYPTLQTALQRVIEFTQNTVMPTGP